MENLFHGIAFGDFFVDLFQFFLIYITFKTVVFLKCLEISFVNVD